MSREIVESLHSSDGHYRVDVFRRDDGLFGFVQMAHYARPEPEGEYWAPLGPWGTITDTIEAAHNEARATFPWLRNSN